MAKIRVVSFGYRFGEPPEADRVFDIRHTRYNEKDWIREAREIASVVEPGETVAIGDLHGETRAVQIADRLADELDNATLTHRDKGKEAMLKGSAKGVVSENVRTLKYQGKSEADAVRIAAKAGKKPKTTVMRRETVKEVE